MFKRAAVMASVALAVLGVGAASASQSSSTSATATNGQAATKPLQIAWFSTKANAFLAAELKAVQAAAKNRGAKITVFDSGFDPNKQFSQVQDAITSKKFDGFIILPVNGAALVPVVRQALAARIKVVGANAALGPNPNAAGVQLKGVSAQIWTSTVTRGKLMASQMIAACRGINPCKVAYHAGVAALPIEQTIKQVFEPLVKKQSNIDYVGYFDGNGYTVDGGQKVAADILTANPDINVIASGDQAALGSALAVRAAGKTPGPGAGQVRILGIGTAGVVLEAIRDGRIFNTQADAAAAEGRFSLQAIVDAVRGRLKRPVAFDPIIRSGKPQIVSRANVGKVKAEY
jgi:ribose transport system substrate-binding protein